MATTAGVERSMESESVSETIVSAVAAHTGSDPLDLAPLYQAVDPDALDALFATDDPMRSPDRVSFTYCGCEVVVSAEGVTVESANRNASKAGDA